MKSKDNLLLLIDGVVDLILGIIILLFPAGMDDFLGLPVSNSYFYSSILGGVLFGIGVALFVERFGQSRNIRGLGLNAAIILNLCGALVLLIWLIFSSSSIPLRGFVILWGVAIAVLVIGIAEIISKALSKK